MQGIRAPQTTERDILFVVVLAVLYRGCVGMESGSPAGGPSSHRHQREPDDGDATYPAKRTRANRGPLCSRWTVALQAMVVQMHQTWMGLRKA